MLTLPNFLTLLRIIAVPVFLILVSYGMFGPALVLFLAAAVTDTVDGVLARLTDSKSDLGAALDPLADKLLVVSAFVSLTTLGVLPVWLFIIVVTRDAVILGGYLALYFVSTAPELKPSQISKVNTFFEMMTIGLALATQTRPDIAIGPFFVAAWYATGTTAAMSGIHYVYMGLLWYQRQSVPGATTEKRNTEGMR